MPFGEAASELELSENYSDLYFGETPFNASAIDPDTYLIIGRRGSGKTALAQYFSFQKVIPNSIYIYVSEPDLYKEVLSRLGQEGGDGRGISIPALAEIWDYVLWCVILEELKERSEVIAQACTIERKGNKASNLVEAIIARIHDFLQSTPLGPEKALADMRDGVHFNEARQAALEVTKKTPVILALDTLEQYDTNDVGLINSIAALIQAAARFNQLYARHGVHLKVLMSGEIFPHLEEGVIQNTLKFVRKPVYLFWRPKDLLRLICWRFYQHLSKENLLQKASKGSIDWTSHKDVLQKMWIPYFGEKLTNLRGAVEETFYYLLRHTQMRPRQLILMCNEIANLAIDDGTFPLIKPEHIRQGILNVESDLAVEIINSFHAIYPNVARIVDALNGTPMAFKGNELAKLAPRSADAWPKGTYSQRNFLALAAELGIIGRVESEGGGVIEAGFEYLLRRRLAISVDDQCVIHPMFYTRLNVKKSRDVRVVPFATNGTFED